VIRDQLGPTLAEAAGADFTSPLENENEAAEVVEAITPREPRPEAVRATEPGHARREVLERENRLRASPNSKKKSRSEG